MIVEIINNGYKGHNSSGKFSVSGLGGCLREKYFSLWKKYKKTFDTKTQRIFSLGDYVHRQCVSDLMSNAPANGFELIAAEVNIPEHEYLSGRIDCILSQMKTGEKIIVDFKSAGKWTFDKVVSGEVPQGYIDQVNMYMHLLNIRKGYLLFVCKNNSDITEFEVKYDEERALKMLKEVEDFFNNNVYQGKIPKRCDGNSFGCDVCDEVGFDIMKAQQEIQDYISSGGKYQDLYGDN